MPIASDFTLDYVNQRVYHSSGTTVYSVNALYSYLQSIFDDADQMDDTIPMSAQTPTDYTVINSWFIDDTTVQYLKGGAIKTSGYASTIYLLANAAGGYTNAIAGDIGKLVHNSGSTHTGTLLFYNNTTKKWWIRKILSTFTAEAITITSGTGAATISTVSNGEDIYPNIYTLGSIDQTYSSFAQQIYIIQNQTHLTEWWPDSATPTNRQIDVLIKTQEAGTAIDSGNLTIFLRHYPTNGTTGGDQIDLYDNFTLSAVLSGRNAVPLATSNDLNNTQSQATAAGYNDIKIVFVNGTITHGSITGTFTALESVSQAVSGATGVFIVETGGVMTLGNVSGTFNNTNVITGGTSGATTTSTGTLSLTNSTRVTGKAFTQDVSYNYSVIIDCAGRVLSQVYAYLKYYTRISATGSSFKTYGVQKLSAAYTIIKIDGEQYINAYNDLDSTTNSFSPVKQSPFGTYAGGKIFAAQGVWLQNMNSADIQNFQLIDSTGTTRTPPNQQAITVSNLLSGDAVAVFRTSSGTTINKSQFTMTVQSSGSGTVIVQEVISSDTPATGYVRVKKASDGSEQRYAYTSWTTSTFTLSGTTSSAYTTSDTAYVPFIDATASGTSASVTVIYVSDRTILVRVRRYNGSGDTLIPFESPGTFTSTGYSIQAIRTADTIAT